MSMMEDYFTSLSIDITEVFDYIAPALPDYMFDSDEILAEVTLTIPDDTTYDKSYFEFARAKHVRNVYTCNLGRIVPLEDDSYYNTITGSETTNVSKEEDQLTVALHGRGMLFETDDDSVEHILRYNYITKSNTKLRDTFYIDFLSCYYYLYNNNIDGFYHYMRQLSKDKDNHKNENKETHVSRRVHYGQIKTTWHR